MSALVAERDQLRHLDLASAQLVLERALQHPRRAATRELMYPLLARGSAGRLVQVGVRTVVQAEADRAGTQRPLGQDGVFVRG